MRWFHFAFGCLVYNMWLLVDFLIQDRIGVIETLSEPRISLSRFLDWLKKELVTLVLVLVPGLRVGRDISKQCGNFSVSFSISHR